MAKLFNAICRNCGGLIKKVPLPNGVKPLSCPACGFTDLYPFDYTGPHEDPAPEPTPQKKGDDKPTK